ncbi:class I SAM-dependent RNA methyltransferase [uncultured Christiangramia sp.]|uniref:THUMP domain-containing class I SAM-dependent RNA methyltransferase n=1 Tax=uncultured Christiangramia sp. TaxID=503836 RepID=UPI0025F63470|nr:class I SAM-dependent RNA methyltransferase [uncultured Christiangramia sp.]|tara:strand:+ start:428 stop:1585 length:1158 start_codon:yes stop_codon:yes gene_type:complete
MDNYRMIAKTLFGFESILAKELLDLGAMDIKEGNRMVSFVGDKGFMYKANLCLRTAIKVLKPYESFKANSEQELYDNIKKLPWEKFLDVEGSLAIDSAVHSDIFTHSQYVALKSKDAIVDRFREKFGKRPDVDLDFPDLRINIHIENNFCNVSFDSSGDSLHKRGYRTATNIAPINEVLAAGMLLMSGWDGQCDFLDPMCGSGTIPIEAAMIACNIPPNLNRKEFAFEKWNDWDENLYEKIEASALKKVRDFHFKIRGYDKAPSAVMKAKDNVTNANLGDFIEIEQKSFFESVKQNEGYLHMLFNPPYGERLEIDIEDFYGKIGDTLKQGYPGTHAWFIATNFDAIKSVGLRASRKIKLYNGPLEGRLLKYVLYEGSKKKSKQED